MLDDADFVMATSALAATVVPALEVLFVRSGSGVTEDTVAVLVIVPLGVEAWTLATMVMGGAVAPAGQGAQAAGDLLGDCRAACARRCGRDEGGTGWQLVGDHCVLGVGGPSVVGREGVGDLVTCKDGGRGGCLGQDQVGFRDDIGLVGGRVVGAGRVGRRRGGGGRVGQWPRRHAGAHRHRDDDGDSFSHCQVAQ